MEDNFKNFKVLGSNILEVLDKVLQDQPLCKLLYYSSPEPLSEPDITDTTTLINSNITLVPSMDFEDTEKNYLVCSLENFAKSQNPQFFDYRLVFYVLCAKNQWMLNDRTLRPLYIMERLHLLFDDHKMSMGGLQFAFSDGIIITPKLLGYQMFFIGTDFL